uniref:Glutathione S-transferase T3-like n=1 Tax=Tanacetum cinerariifolium TaxID=118510 RepID=A0A699INL0_TANCI|nr:hypothetical protein [Tanacetum cinerariifolium]
MEVPDAGVSFRWQPDEETLLAKCYVSVSEDRNVGRSQPNDTFWYRVLNEFNRLNFQKRTKDMLSSKWNTLNHNCQKFNAIYKRCSRLTQSCESELDKWDAPPPEPGDLSEDEEIPAGNIDELFVLDARPRPPGKQLPGKKTKSDTSVSTEGSSSSSQFGDIMTKELRLNEKPLKPRSNGKRKRPRGDAFGRDETSRISAKDLLEDDTCFIEEQKRAIRTKYNLYRNSGCSR